MTITFTDDVVADSLKAYDGFVESYIARTQDLMADTVDRFLAAMPAGAHILDAGCGPGRDLARFRAAGHQAIGLDGSPAFAALANTYAPTMLGDIADIPFPDESFDGIWACASLVHFPADRIHEPLAELARTARPGASVYVSVKISGETGWQDTAEGRRWFQVWEPDRFTTAVAAAGLQITNVDINPVFVDVWATKPAHPES